MRTLLVCMLEVLGGVSFGPVLVGVAMGDSASCLDTHRYTLTFTVSIHTL